jgi:hypothetical protein
MTERSRYWVPSRTFELILKIGSKDFTNDIVELTILTSIALPYQTFLFKVYLDPNDIILDKIYGQIPIELQVILLATEAYPQEETKFELMYLQSDLPVSQLMERPENQQKDRQLITFTAVARQAYKTMNTYVNDIYSGKTVYEAITNLVQKTGASIKYDTANQNTEKIDQILVPPSTLYNNLKYINRTFGLYDGLPAIYCSHDNIIYIKNLTNKMKQAQAFTVYNLATDIDASKVIEKCDDGKHYYTRRNINTNYEGNSAFAFLAPKMIYVVKPRDRLEQRIEVILETFTKKYGLISNSDKIFFDKSAITSDSRVSIHKDHTGYELTESFIRSTEAEKISKIADMMIVVENNIRILNLMKVGESVEVTSKTQTTNELAGRYMLNTSEIRFSKVRDWETSATLSLIRSNRTLIRQ